MADRTAQHAIANQSVQVEVGLELNEINHCILQYINEKWQHIWTTSATGRFYGKIEPLISRNIRYTHVHELRAKETTITRLRFGKFRINEYLTKLNVTDSEKCVQCTVRQAPRQSNIFCYSVLAANSVGSL